MQHLYLNCARMYRHQLYKVLINRQFDCGRQLQAFEQTDHFYLQNVVAVPFLNLRQIQVI